MGNSYIPDLLNNLYDGAGADAKNGFDNAKDGELTKVMVCVAVQPFPSVTIMV